ncbi:hypothetical protein ACU19_04990 [Actinobaculum suis]|uniref:helix-turn-helix domain-containing protein n=1 Tax=Actinobaculum suis TaxID=1657 RepID=UPI00066FF66D|nr:DUF1870 family protein [Actinobaculum suis]KMY23329.1 hypothetical protein ACU19_04990 [Actinobaculum suis]
MEKPETLPEMTGLEFAAIRHRMNLSPVDLARLLEIDTRSLRRWEAGKLPIPAAMVARLRKLEGEHARLASDYAAALGVVGVRRDPNLYRALPRKWYVSALARAMEANPDLRADWA